MGDLLSGRRQLATPQRNPPRFTSPCTGAFSTVSLRARHRFRAMSRARMCSSSCCGRCLHVPTALTRRHGHLMLYDDAEQLEVRHVISLGHHVVSIYGGEDENIPEGEL